MTRYTNLSLFILVSLIFSTKIMLSVLLDQYEVNFTYIYDHAVWGKNDQGIGFSGGGSYLYNVKEYLELLSKFMKVNSIKSVLDAGCGDWEFSKYVNWDGIEYFGYDVVASVIKKNNDCFSKENIHFIHANFLNVELPKADLFLCKHVFQHIPNIDIVNFLPQLKKFRYCLITNEVNQDTFSSNNDDIEIGGYRKIDLCTPPFNLAGIKILNYRIGTAVHQVILLDNSKA